MSGKGCSAAVRRRARTHSKLVHFDEIPLVSPKDKRETLSVGLQTSGTVLTLLSTFSIRSE